MVSLDLQSGRAGTLAEPARELLGVPVGVNVNKGQSRVALGAVLVGIGCRKPFEPESQRVRTRLVDAARPEPLARPGERLAESAGTPP